MWISISKVLLWYLLWRVSVWQNAISESTTVRVCGVTFTIVFVHIYITTIVIFSKCVNSFILILFSPEEFITITILKNVICYYTSKILHYLELLLKLKSIRLTNTVVSCILPLINSANSAWNLYLWKLGCWFYMKKGIWFWTHSNSPKNTLLPPKITESTWKYTNRLIYTVYIYHKKTRKNLSWQA